MLELSTMGPGFVFNMLWTITLFSTTLSAFSFGIFNDSPPKQVPLVFTEEAETVPFAARVHWMRQASAGLLPITGSACPFEAFGTAIVNHSDTSNSPFGNLICLGANDIVASGNPTLHGEIAAINNCTKILKAKPYKLSATEVRESFKNFTLYTNAEACPMCATAIRWAGFKEYVFGTQLETLVELGWQQVDIKSGEIIKRSSGLLTKTKPLSGVLENETDVLFGWQYKENGKCPEGCERKDGTCQNS